MYQDIPQIYTPRTQSLGTGVYTPPPVKNSIASTSFPATICFIDPTGTVQQLTWQDDQTTIQSTQYTNAIALAGGSSFVLILHADGRVSCLNMRDQYGVAHVPANLDHVVAISAGLFNAYALRSNMSVVAWGRNEGQQAGMINFYTHIQAVLGGRHHVAFTHVDGTLEYFGLSGYNERDTNPLYTADIRLLGGYDLYALAWLNDGRVVDLYDPRVTTIYQGDDVIQLACSRDLHAILTSDGRAVVRSRFDFWQHPDFMDQESDFKPVIIENVAHIVGSSDYMFVVLSNGQVRIWNDTYSETKEITVPDTVRCRVL